MEAFRDIYSSYIVNILDILILTFLFYKAILFIKGTKAIQIILGILVILALTVIARDVLHLKALSLLLNNFWFAAVIIFTVVFHPEIRNFLAPIGGHVRGTGTGIKDRNAQEIVEASEDLSVAMTGALIAIENDVGLRNFAETGVALNANVSKELLLSIFKNKSAPLHDGAVIISHDKLVAAGCLLPLSNDMNVKIFGTRHRAALGLSEITDAIVVVVSEETGQISVAYKGRLRGNITVQKLAEIINSNGQVLEQK
ncbi:MAG: diadenylate cyclase CdaA [Endomicrobia bacterium]|nr:diadenylate cyclase CdaA [Endomicrobiia bacterium]